MNATEELRNVVYYKRKKFVDVTEMYDIDSQENFMQPQLTITENLDFHV